MINDNELYYLGTARLMEEIGQRELSEWPQLFCLSVSLPSSLPLWACYLVLIRPFPDCETPFFSYYFLWLAQMAAE